MVIDDIIEYLQNKIDNDDTLPDIKVIETYIYGHKVKKTEIQVQFTEHSEYEKYTTFDGIEVSVCPLVINIYATQEKITETVDGETVEKTVTAQRMSYLLAQKLARWLNYAEIIQSIPDVLGATRARYLPGQPFDTGTILYHSVVRVNLHIRNI